MRIMKMALVAIATLSLVSTAKADILLEPYLGYTYGKAKNEVSGTTQEWDNNNLQLGARVGWQFLVAMAGLDYAMPVSGKFKGTAGGATDYDYSGSQLWAFAGARLPLVRAYAGYGLMSTTELKDASGTTTVTGDSTKLGASFTGIPLFSINAEYIMNTNKKIKSNGVESDVGSGAITKSDGTTFMVSISAPLSF